MTASWVIGDHKLRTPLISAIIATAHDSTSTVHCDVHSRYLVAPCNKFFVGTDRFEPLGICPGN